MNFSQFSGKIFVEGKGQLIAIFQQNPNKNYESTFSIKLQHFMILTNRLISSSDFLISIEIHRKSS
jgi:hypothetical protein